MCPKSGKRCSGNCGNGLSGSIGKLRTSDGDWYTPENLDDLLAVLSHLPQGCKYRLVAGNTGTGQRMFFIPLFNSACFRFQL